MAFIVANLVLQFRFLNRVFRLITGLQMSCEIHPQLTLTHLASEADVCAEVHGFI